MRWSVRGIAALCVAACVPICIPQQPPTPRAIVERYCIACHNAKTKAGNLALDAIAAEDVAHRPDTWEKVVRKLRARYMPPIGLPRPDEATYNSVVSSLESALDQAAAAKPNPGRTDTFRRLNR